MRRNRISFYILLSFVLVFTSCLKDDDTTTVYPSDAAITSFVLGSLKQYVTTKAKNGSDSTYTKTLTGSKYKFYIDQVNRTIYNPDSLPYGTDVKRVLCTITAKNSGTIAIKKVTSDTLLYYNSNDSIDFSTPRTLKVFSLDGTNVVDYTVNVNVRKEIPDTFIWNNVSSQPFVAEAAAMKALSCGNQMFVMVSNGTSSTLYGTDETSGVEWTPMGWNINMPIPANAYENIVSKNNTLYLYCGNTILKSTDGNYWEKTANAYLSRLVAAYGNYIYALDLQGKLVASADEGATWQPETLDSDASLLPTQDLSYCIIPSAINPDTKTLLLVGNRNASHYPDDNQAHVWSKVIEGDDTDSAHSTPCRWAKTYWPLVATASEPPPSKVSARSSTASMVASTGAPSAPIACRPTSRATMPSPWLPTATTMCGCSAEEMAVYGKDTPPIRRRAIPLPSPGNNIPPI